MKDAAPKKPRGAAKPKAAKAARQKKATAQPEKKPPTRKPRAKAQAIKPDAPAIAAQHAAPTDTPPREDAPPPDTSAGGGEPLLPQHERFAQAIALGMSQAAAYRATISSTAKTETAYCEGSKLANDPKIAQRVTELREEAKRLATAAFRYEYADAMRELDAALKVAELQGDSSAMSKATMGKIEISGLKVDPRANDRDPFKGLTDAELEGELQRAAREAGVQVTSPGLH